MVKGASKERSVLDVKTGLEICPARDENLTEFSKTLLKNFYLKGEETPQEGFARASLAWSGGDKGLAQRLYDYSSKKWFMFASPVLSNAPEAETLNPLKFKKTKGMPISCFKGDTLVKMDNGYKKIEDIEIGDNVLSDDGTYNKVSNKWSSNSSDMYEIDIDGELIEVTGNHLFLTKNHGWVRVDELDPEVHELSNVIE